MVYELIVLPIELKMKKNATQEEEEKRAVLVRTDEAIAQNCCCEFYQLVLPTVYTDSIGRFGNMKWND